MIIKTYTELSKIKTFQERFEYLKLNGQVGMSTFGYDRIFNQMFYRSREWKNIRNYVITRDLGCDLGIEEYEIPKGVNIYIHHLNPISMKDLENKNELLLDPNNLITTIHETHNAIHYGDMKLLRSEPTERYAKDTCPWIK
ncbi:MAG: hypothetical protein ACK5K7_00230 [Bacilli bacterium]